MKQILQRPFSKFPKFQNICRPCWTGLDLNLTLRMKKSNKSRSNELDFSNTTCNICRTFGCTLLHTVGSLRGQTHQAFCHDICSKRGASYRNKRNVLLHNICRCNIFDPDQTSFNNMQHIATCINKVVKRSRLFPHDKCCMLYCEKSSSFDQ